MPEVLPESSVRDSVAVVTAALLPGLMFASPRRSARLDKTAADLPLVLRHAARVNAAVSGFGRPNASMIHATVGLLRASRCRRRSGGGLMLCRGLWPVGRLPLLWFTLISIVLLLLSVHWSCGCEDEKQSSRGDTSSWFHEWCLHDEDSCDLRGSSGRGCGSAYSHRKVASWISAPPPNEARLARLDSHTIYTRQLAKSSDFSTAPASRTTGFVFACPRSQVAFRSTGAERIAGLRWWGVHSRSAAGLEVESPNFERLGGLPWDSSHGSWSV